MICIYLNENFTRIILHYNIFVLLNKLTAHFNFYDEVLDDCTEQIRLIELLMRLNHHLIQ